MQVVSFVLDCMYCGVRVRVRVCLAPFPFTRANAALLKSHQVGT